ncbi:copper amine oxidase N-terminal domain-containing protein [Lysinibacillus sp. NPDC056232]|uniref:copper amine oxidase N-terminal domain-containing protein n=1 Tax=Lysinibacillus sp. NPDC056232 TaxID=3345756 RepID=UPI0035D96061
MNRNLKLLIASFVTFILLAVYPISSMAATSSLPDKETPIYLKMDKYFILYTKPSSPFLNQQGRLLVPLRSIQDLMGGEVSYNHHSKTATVKILNNSFDVTINSKIAYVNKKEVKMDTIPVLKKDAMFLPIRLFLDHTDIEYKYINDLKLLHIKDKRVLVGKPFDFFDENDYTNGYIDGSFHLSAFKIVNSGLSIKAQNLTGETVPEGKTDIQPLVQMNSGWISVDSYIRPGNKKIPEIKKGQSFWINKDVEVNDAAYIISVGRKAP